MFDIGGNDPMKKRIPIIVLLLALAGFGGWVLVAKTRRAESGALQFHGNVDIREVNLGFRVSGRLLEVKCDEGDAVKADELLARLDDEPYRRDVEASRAQVASLRARLQLLETGNRPQEIAASRAVLREREASATNAAIAYKRAVELLATRTISQQEHDDAEAQNREAAARANSAREQLNLLEAGFRSEDIAQAKAELARAEANLAGEELKVQDTLLKAPSDGVVLTRAQEPGAVLQTGATVLTVSLVRPVWVRAYVSEPDLGRIHPGTKVEIRTDTRRGQPYLGQVGYISPRAEFTPKNVETADLRTSLVYRLRVVVENPDEGLRQGMPVTVKVLP
jgi:HlyD family secretion protein